MQHHDPWAQYMCCDVAHSATTSGSAAASAAAQHAVGTPSSSPPSPVDGPCPFETYCCLDEHCADAACSGPHAPCDPCDECAPCSDGVACDDPACAAESVCCDAACASPCDSNGGGACDDAMCGTVCADSTCGEVCEAACEAACEVPCEPACDDPRCDWFDGLDELHVCHWSNCHLTFSSMPDLLAHVAADHLGAVPQPAQAESGGQHAGEPSLRTPPPNVDMPAQAVVPLPHTQAAQAIVAQQPGAQPPADPASAWQSPSAAAQAAADLSFLDALLASAGQHNAGVAGPVEADPLLSCLWDDCLPLLSPAVMTEPSAFAASTHGLLAAAAHAEAVAGIAAAGAAHSHSTGHAHVHGGAEAFSPQTMLRHVLEEHLGVSSDLVGWPRPRQDGFAPESGAVGVSTIADAHGSHLAHTHAHAHLHHAYAGHTHAHVHGGAAFGHSHDQHVDHLHLRTGTHDEFAHGHAHAHAHAHAHVHAHDHAHGHGHGRHRPHRLHPLPTPPSSTSPPSPSCLLCLWPGCALPPFASTAELMEHVAEAHVGRGKDAYVCRWGGCAEIGREGAGEPGTSTGGGRVFRSRQKVLRHLGSHVGHRPFVCDQCGQAFSEAAPLAAHMRRHAHDKPYACTHPGCGKRFAIASSLTIHMRTHNGDKPFVCPHCNKGFVEASNLTKHIRTHTGERPFACTHPGCGRRFPRPDQLKRHMAVHDGKARAAKGSKVEAA